MTLPLPRFGPRSEYSSRFRYRCNGCAGSGPEASGEALVDKDVGNDGGLRVPLPRPGQGVHLGEVLQLGAPPGRLELVPQFLLALSECFGRGYRYILGEWLRAGVRSR